MTPWQHVQKRLLFRVSSSYWDDFEQNEFVLNSISWRTETFDWIRDELPSDDETVLSIDSQNFDLDESEIESQEINAFVAYSSSYASNEIQLLRYESPQVKSSYSKVKTVLVNPTKYWILPSLGKISIWCWLGGAYHMAHIVWFICIQKPV